MPDLTLWHQYYCGLSPRTVQRYRRFGRS